VKLCDFSLAVNTSYTPCLKKRPTFGLL